LSDKWLLIILFAIFSRKKIVKNCFLAAPECFTDNFDNFNAQDFKNRPLANKIWIHPADLYLFALKARLPLA